MLFEGHHRTTAAELNSWKVQMTTILAILFLCFFVCSVWKIFVVNNAKEIWFSIPLRCLLVPKHSESFVLLECFQSKLHTLDG